MYGNSAGYFYLHADQPTTATNPACLKVAVSWDSTVETFNGYNNYVTTPDLTAYPQTTSNGFFVSFTDNVTQQSVAS